MSKVYFNLRDLFNETNTDTGNRYHIDLNSIKVNGVEELTTDYFSETTRFNTHVFSDAVNPHTGNVWEYSNCTQIGVYPFTTTINQCAISGAANSYNPFAHFLKVNYSDTVDGVKRGHVTNSISGNLYGLETFGFGFDKVTVPINDAAPSNGSSGASVDGAFWLDLDYAQDLSLSIWVSKWSAAGDKLWSDLHLLTISENDCDFAVKVRRQNFNPTNFGPLEDVTQLCHLTGGLSGWIIPDCSEIGCEPFLEKDHTFTENQSYRKIVSGNNGFKYLIPYESTTIRKINETDLSVTLLPDVINDYYADAELAPNGKIYCVPNTGQKIMIIDPSTDLVTFVNITGTTEGWASCGINSAGILYSPPDSNVGFDPKNWLKFDTNTLAVTLLYPSTGLNPNYETAIMASNDKMYCFSSIAGSPIYEFDTATETPLAIGSTQTVFVYADAGYEHSNGNLYVVGHIETPSSNPKMIKIILSSGLMSEIDLGLTQDLQYSGINMAKDGNVWLTPLHVNNPAALKLFDVTTESITGTTHIKTSIDPAGSQLISSCQTATGGLIYLALTDFLVNPTSDSNSIVSLTFINCEGEEGLPVCDAIVTQAIGLLAPPRREKVILFTTDKDCCYHSLVVGDLNDDVDYKNDVNGFLFSKDFSSETIEFVLLKNGGAAEGGTDIPMVNNDYGTFYNFGAFANYPNYKGYQVEWRKVLNLEGEGDYQIQITSTLVTGVDVSKSIPFKLRTYTPECVLGTVRIQSIMNGYLRNPDFNYKGLNWIDGIRFCGMFGNRQPEYEEERIIYSNREVKQLRSELINKYNMKSMHLPSCVTDIVLEYHNLANKMLITDYNDVNHKVYIQTEVILDSVNTIEYPVVANKAPLDIVYKDYVQDYNKSNC